MQQVRLPAGTKNLHKDLLANMDYCRRRTHLRVLGLHPVDPLTGQVKTGLRFRIGKENVAISEQ